MKLSRTLVVAGMLAFAGSAFANSPTAMTTATPAATTAAKSAKAAAPAATDKQAISKKCSADANAKSLHGKARKKFRDDCIAAAKKS